MSTRIYHRRRKPVTLEVKLQVLHRFESGEKAADISRDLGLPVTTCRNIRDRDADRIKESAKNLTPLDTKRITRTKTCIMSRMEFILCEWIKENQFHGLLDRHTIQAKAKSIFENLKSKCCSKSSEEFGASRGWYERFKKRAHLNVLLNGESASAALIFPPKLQQAIEAGGYCSKQVFNIDETKLFWTCSSEDGDPPPGFKVSKDRLTIVLGGNAEGDFKLDPLIVSNSESQGPMIGHSQAVWCKNKKSLVTPQLFQDWLKAYAIPALEEYCSKQNLPFKVLLILDSAPSHPGTLNELSENVKVVFLPLNTTSLIQPMDQDVISNFKVYYMRRTFSQLFHEAGENKKAAMKDFWGTYSVEKGIENIVHAWNEVTATCLNKAWLKIWPQCVRQFDGCRDKHVPFVSAEIASLARQVEFEGMEEDITGEATTEDSVHFEEEEEEEEESPPKVLTANRLAHALGMVKEAMKILDEDDPDKVRSARVARVVEDSLSCYREIYAELKRKT